MKSFSFFQPLLESNSKTELYSVDKLHQSSKHRNCLFCEFVEFVSDGMGLLCLVGTAGVVWLVRPLPSQAEGGLSVWLGSVRGVLFCSVPVWDLHS